jgi:hypothetical protein
LAAGAQPQQPPLPPDVQAQQSPEQAQSVFADQGLGQPQPGMDTAKQVMAQLQKLDSWVGETKNLLQAYDPSLLPMLEQIGKPAMAIAEAIQKKAKASGQAQGAPVVPGQPPPSPAAGPPNPNSVS